MNKLSSENVYAYIFMGEDLCSPRIEISSDYDTVANFIAQASTLKNGFVRIVDILDRHILDAKLVDLEIFKEFKFNTGLDLGIRNHISLNALRYFEEQYLPKKVNILNVDYWSSQYELNSNEEILKSLNEKVYCNFKIN